ncbi:hypothetical protein [Salinicola tamaricis]|uniref:hypothetical protein n=1 Tax=Salinicola tamaricis TaxID=1771309 RepID=UPI0030F384C2
MEIPNTMTPIIAFGEALVDMLSSRLGDDTGPETFTPMPVARPPMRPWPAPGRACPACSWA